MTKWTSLRSKNFVTAAFAAAVAAITLNVPQFQFDPLMLWVKVTCPILLFIGILGSLYGSRLLWILGWLGILLFIGCTIGMIIPGDDYMSGGMDGPPLTSPIMVSIQEIVLRLVLCILLVVALVTSYVRLGSLGKSG
jgi:hypothetical protein